MGAFLNIDSWADVPDAIRRLELAGAHHRVPLLQALYRGEIAHIELQRTGCAGKFKRWAAGIRLPGIALLGDDDDHSTGPDGWSVAQRVLRWSRQVIIHGTGGEAIHYRAAIVGVQISRRLAFIECNTATLDAWTDAAIRWAPQAGKLRLETRDGGVHPVPPDRESVH